MSSFTRHTDIDLFLPGLRKVIVNILKTVPWIYDKYMFVGKSDNYREDTHSFFSGFNTIPEKPEGSNYAFGTVMPGYDKQFVHTTYAFGLRYTQEAKEDERYGVLKKFPTFLADAVKHTVELTAIAVLENGFTVNGPDGVPLFSTAHPMLDGTQSNRPAAEIDLGYAALEAALTNIYNQKTYEGYPINDVEKKILMFHPNSWALVKKLFGSDTEPFTSNNTINVLSGLFEPLRNPYIGDTDSWFVLTQPKDDFIQWYWRVRPYTFSDEDPNNGDLRYIIRMRCSAGANLWYGNYASTGI